MAKLKSSTMMWVASDDGDVIGYKVYWEIPPGPITYDSPSLAVGKVTKVSLPLEGMPAIDGTLVLGVTAVDDVGNESDIVSGIFPFDFQPPHPCGPISVV